MSKKESSGHPGRPDAMTNISVQGNGAVVHQAKQIHQKKVCDQGERPLMYGLPRAAVTIVVGRLAIAARNHLISSGPVDPGRRQPSPS